MGAVRGRDTKPEIALRRALHARGLRYRIHPVDVPGRPDVVNRSRRIAIFVDGDFWHGNPEEWRRRGFDSLEAQFPEPKREFWTGKIRSNIARDVKVNDALRASGWTVVRVWESEIHDDPDAVALRLVALWSQNTSSLR